MSKANNTPPKTEGTGKAYEEDPVRRIADKYAVSVSRFAELVERVLPDEKDRTDGPVGVTQMILDELRYGYLFAKAEGASEEQAWQIVAAVAESLRVELSQLAADADRESEAQVERLIERMRKAGKDKEADVLQAKLDAVRAGKKP